MLAAVVVVIAVVATLAAMGIGARRERDAAQNLGEARGFYRLESLACGKARRREIVGDGDQLVRIGALIAAAADRRRDGPDRGGAVLVDAAGKVAQAVGGRRPWQPGRRVVAGGIVINRVGRAQPQSGLQDVSHGPSAVVEDPFLQSRRGLR